jgi:hypothetical protein
VYENTISPSIELLNLFGIWNLAREYPARKPRATLIREDIRETIKLFLIAWDIGIGSAALIPCPLKYSSAVGATRETRFCSVSVLGIQFRASSGLEKAVLMGHYAGIMIHAINKNIDIHITIPLIILKIRMRYRLIIKTVMD